MRATLVYFLLVISSFSVRSWAMKVPCEYELLQPRLGIGVLGRTLLGFPIIGVGSYVGAHHQDVIEKMKKRHHVTRLEWLGELRYITDRDQIRIYEVNETSGHFVHGESELPMRNDARLIPHKWRASRFVIHPFDPNSPHLDQTLNALTGNVRHELSNGLQKFSSLMSVLSSARFPVKTKLELAEGFRNAPESSVTLMEWMIEGLILERAITEYDVQETRLALRLLTYPGLSIHFLDPGAKALIEEELALLSAAIRGEEPFGRVRIIADYWPF